MTEKNKGFTRTIADFIVNTKETDIPAEVYEHAKIALLDWIGVALAGKNDPLVEKLIRYTDIMGGNENATIIGHDMKKSLSQAALINGAESHALDYDDTMTAFFGHPSVTMFSSLLALAEFKEKNGRDFLTSYIIGLKTGTTVGSCAGMDHYMSGWHATCTVGHFASVAVCSRLLGLNLEQTIYAIGIAGTLASGLKESFGTMCKPFHAGKAAQSGLMAALLASDGFTASKDIFEGEHGFFKALKGKAEEKIVSTLGKKWDIEDLAQKYHASCHGTHSPIEALSMIVQREGISAEDIDSAKVTISPLCLTAAGKTDPQTGLEGKFSINYCLALSILRGNTGMQAFTDKNVHAPEIQEFMKRVSLEVDENLSMLGIRLEIKTKGGDIYNQTTDVMKDIPELDNKRRKIKDKFIDLCGPVMGDNKTRKILDDVLSLEKFDNMKGFVEQLG